MLYLYALSDGLDNVEGLVGLAGERLDILTLAETSVVVGWMTALPDLTRGSLQAQDAVVRVLHARAGALLPFRFGTTAQDIETATRSIDVIRPDLPNRFARVRGRDQMTVRVLRSTAEGIRPDLSPVVPDGEGPGARFLRSRAAARSWPETLNAVFDAVTALVRDTLFEPGRQDAVIGTVYQLIDRGTDAEYRTRLAGGATMQPDLRLRVSGPSPAYAFAAG